jgi:trigger factor
VVREAAERHYTLPPVKATVEPLEGNKVRVAVEVDEAEFDKAIDAAFRKIAREVRIPGFRPGKAPRKVLERRLGPEVGREQALHDSLPEYYARALSDNDVDAIAAPEIDITDGAESGPLLFAAVVEIRPEVTVGGYDGLRVTLDRPEVPDEEIDAQVDRMRQTHATLGVVDRPAVDGDVVTIDIAGTLDGESQPGLTADDYSYTVGSGMVVPELDDQLRGTKAGDILSFDATHPDPDETRDLEFRVLVKEVNERVLPDADDEWASQASEFDTIDELRGSIRQRMELVRRAQVQSQLTEKATEALAELVDAEPPKALVDQEAQNRLQDLALRLSAQGVDPQAWLAAQQAEGADGLNAELREAATTSAKVDLALRAVADAETIEASDDEVDAEILQMAERLSQKPDRLRAEFERGGRLPAVRSDIRKRKALDWLLEHVEIVDQDGQPLARADLDITVEGAEGDESPGSPATAASDDTEQTDQTDDSDRTSDTETDPE